MCAARSFSRIKTNVSRMSKICFVMKSMDIEHKHFGIHASLIVAGLVFAIIFSENLF